MKSIRERILQTLMAMFQSVASNQGATLIRSPTTPVSREQSPALLLIAESDQVSARPNDRVERQLVLRLALPANPFVVEERLVVQVGKTPYVRFDLNDYSVAHTQVRKSLTVLAGASRIRIVDGLEVVASHARCYDKGQQIELEVHIKDLVERKAQARSQRGMSRLRQAAPSSQELLNQAGARGENLGSITSTLLRLVDRYGACEVQTAIVAALARGVPHPNAVRLALETQREARQRPAPVDIELSAKVRQRDAVIHAHRLDSYDQLGTPPPPTPSANPATTPKSTPTPDGDDDETQPR